MMDEIQRIVAVCEEYADNLFDGDEYYTQITKWQDGDFSIEVRHGFRHQDGLYGQREQVVQYRHHDGVIVYADKTRLIDRKRDEIHEQRELERP